VSWLQPVCGFLIALPGDRHPAVHRESRGDYDGLPVAVLDHHTHAQIAGVLNDRGLTSGEGRPFHRLIIRNIRDEYGLRSREQRLRDAGMLTLAEMASRLGMPAKTVKIWYHAGLITGHPYNDKGQCLCTPPGPNPPTRAQGRKLSERRPGRHTAPANDQ
jgi:hypothetical protein